MFKFTKYDIWAFFLGAAVASYFNGNDWKLTALFLVLCGLSLGWRSIYHPAKYTVDYRDPQELEAEDEKAYQEYLTRKAEYDAQLKAESEKENNQDIK